MCTFPSWIKTEKDDIFFLTDKECQNINDNDCIGHSAIKKVFPGIKGEHGEGFPCPPEIIRAIQKGQCKKMMKISGYKKLTLNSEGQPHKKNGPAIEYYDGTKLWFLNGNFHRVNGPAVEYSSGTKLWYLNGNFIKRTIK